MLGNSSLIEKTVEITIARLSNSNLSVNGEGGKKVGEFMQEIYNKLVELNKGDIN